MLKQIAIDFTDDAILFSSVAQSCLTLWPHGLQHARLPCPSPALKAYSDSRPLSQWCHPTISSSVVPFSSCLQSFLASGSFPMSQLFTSGGQSVRVSGSVLPVNIQGWFPLGLTGSISLPFKGLSRVVFSTTVQTERIDPKKMSSQRRENITSKVFLWAGGLEQSLKLYWSNCPDLLGVVILNLQNTWCAIRPSKDLNEEILVLDASVLS